MNDDLAAIHAKLDAVLASQEAAAKEMTAARASQERIEATVADMKSQLAGLHRTLDEAIEALADELEELGFPTAASGARAAT